MKLWRPSLTRTLAITTAVAGVCVVATLRVSASTTAASSKTKTPPAAASHSSAKPKTAKSKTAKSKTASKRTSVHSTSRKGKRGKRGQQKIDAERTHQIQEALIRQHYMEGKPSGKWDASTEVALRKFQADNGWQSKTVPDSRALIRLGLGPNHDHLLNPESAMTTTPAAPATTATPATAPVGNGNSPTANQPQP